MPVNPMQRRMKNSFLIGFLLAVIIMALVVLVLVYKMKSIQDENAKMLALQKNYYVASEDLKSGDVVTMESFIMEKVQTSIDPETVIDEDTFMFHDDLGEPIIKYNSDGSEKPKEMIVKVDIPAGAVVTESMLAESTKEITDDQRIQEFNMISLPSQLEEGDYIDVRLSFPEGQDYIVLSKKRVLQCTETAIWLRLSEQEILTVNNAIVESYIIPGSKLYALPYTEPGIQEALDITYPVNSKVYDLAINNPNLTDSEKASLTSMYFANNQAAQIQRTTVIDQMVEKHRDSMETNVESKNQEELSKIQSAREEYVDSLGE